MLTYTGRFVLTVTVLSALLLTSVSLGGCVTEKDAYQAAVADGTHEAMREFLELHPDGMYASMARPDLDELLWEEATTVDTAEAYEAYLSELPDGIHSQDARSAAPAVAWREMDFYNDRQAIESFLVKYEYSAYAKKARERLALLDLYPSHLSIGETVLVPAETGGWQITTEVQNIGAQEILDIGFRVGFEGEEGVILAQLESFMDEQTAHGENRTKGAYEPLIPGATRTFRFDVAPEMIPDGWLDDADHVRLVLSTMTLADV